MEIEKEEGQRIVDTIAEKPDPDISAILNDIVDTITEEQDPNISAILNEFVGKFLQLITHKYLFIKDL